MITLDVIGEILEIWVKQKYSRQGDTFFVSV